MRKPIILTLATTLALLVSACRTSGRDSGGSTPFESTPIAMTAVVSTVMPETAGPPATDGASPTPVPPTPIPTLPASGLSPSELKYRVLEEFPDFFFCDPDFYPVARAEEAVLALQRFPEIQANREEFQAILHHSGLSGQSSFTEEQKLLIYREHKRLAAVLFELVGVRYQFQVQTGMEGQQGAVITGQIDGNGSIDIIRRDPGFPTCPICLAAGTRIDTPWGPIAVEYLRAGSPVWTVNASGERVPATVLRTARVRVTASHQIIHIVLSDGRELWASPGHPTADERLLDDLKVGDFLDGARVTLIEQLPYTGIATYDLLPAGDTAFYWADGILLGSTLANE